MLELETETILKSLISKTIGEEDSISLKAIVGSDIPKGIKVYIQTEVEQGLKAELRASEKFSRVGGTSSTGSHLMKTFLGTLALEYVFPRNEFITMLDNATHFLENYLCRPHWTLEHFLFEDADRISCDTLLMKLQYFTEYSYLTTLIERLVRQRGWQDIALGDFRSLLVIIDDQIVKQHSAKELAILARPIFEFLLLGNVSPHSTVSLKPLLVFFEDKNMRILKLYLERICQIRGKTGISITELAGIIEDLYTDSLEKTEHRETARKAVEEAPPVPRHDEPPLELPFADVPRDVPPEPSQKPMTFKSAPPDAPTIFAFPPVSGDVADAPSLPAMERPSDVTSSATPDDGFESDDVPDAVEDTIPEREAEPASEGKKNIPLSLTFAGMKQEQAPATLPDLNAVISKGQRELFIRKLFKKNEPLYADIIAELNTASNWRQASLLLNEMFEAMRLDPFSDEAIEFTDTVQQRYTIEPTKPS